MIYPLLLAEIASLFYKLEASRLFYGLSNLRQLSMRPAKGTISNAKSIRWTYSVFFSRQRKLTVFDLPIFFKDICADCMHKIE